MPFRRGRLISGEIDPEKEIGDNPYPRRDAETDKILSAEKIEQGEKTEGGEEQKTGDHRDAVAVGGGEGQGGDEIDGDE
ncbi:MAG: hypothetical protein NTV79_00665 [Candidatus Aureabacteria bacterium]|nr:hypothetical protein [Candidatus Auribacterota bacterium]